MACRVTQSHVYPRSRLATCRSTEATACRWQDDILQQEERGSEGRGRGRLIDVAAVHRTPPPHTIILWPRGGNQPRGICRMLCQSRPVASCQVSNLLAGTAGAGPWSAKRGE